MCPEELGIVLWPAENSVQPPPSECGLGKGRWSPWSQPTSSGGRIPVSRWYRGKFRARRIVPASSFLSENVEEDSIGYEPGERHYELEGTDSTGTASISCFSTLKTSG